MNMREESYEVVVMGGGLSGFCAAVAAARQGRKTCLIHNRPVLGGNASSEMRVTIHGAACHHPYARETGIVGEILNAERRTNHISPNENGWTNSVFDMALYDIAVKEPLLTLHLNTDLHDLELADGKRGLDALAAWPLATTENGYYLRPACNPGQAIRSVFARVQNAEVELNIRGKIFIDCTGDALAAHLAGCKWRMGSESQEETGELHAPDHSSTDTMGNSIHIRCVDTGRPSPYQAPAWAMHYDNPDFFYKQGRKPHDPQGGFWWIEIGVPWHTIHDNETIRHELTRHALGVWDWMKNRDPLMMERCRTFALDFIGQVPGKRESRRVIGEHFLNENELQRCEAFPDEVAYGGWFIDLHTPGGLLAEHSEPASAAGYDSSRKDIALKYIGPYGIPLRSLISKDVPNLMMAGRNISVTHAALGTVRVMATCGLMGEAVGITAAVCLEQSQTPRQSADRSVGEIQQRLLRAGCFLPNTSLLSPAGDARVTASSQAVFSGMGAWERGEDQRLRDYVRDRGFGEITPLTICPSNSFFVSGGILNRIFLHLVSETGGKGKVRLRKVKDIWAYDRDAGKRIWEQDFQVAAGHDGMMAVDTNLSGLEDGCYRLECEGDAGVAWRLSTRAPWGVVGGWLVGSGRFHCSRHGCGYAMQVEPAQPVYGPEQVLSGVTRPQARAHAWFADGPLPQTLDLEWPEARKISELQITFPGQLMHEPHGESPFYIAPHIAKRYRILAWEKDAWNVCVEEKDNKQVRCSHVLDASISTRSLRVEIVETYGGAAGITEIRVDA